MLPPRLSGRSRRKAGENAVKARQERAKIKEKITNGEIFFFDLFGNERKSVKRMKMIDLLSCFFQHHLVQRPLKVFRVYGSF